MNTITQNFRVLEETTGWVQRCLYLIERHAPRLMRHGGGGLSRETNSECKRLNNEERMEIVRLAAQGVSQDEIARRFGCRQGTVSKTLARKGVIVKREEEMKAKRELVAQLIRAGMLQKHIMETANCGKYLVQEVRASMQ